MCAGCRRTRGSRGASESREVRGRPAVTATLVLYRNFLSGLILIGAVSAAVICDLLSLHTYCVLRMASKARYEG